MTPPDITEQRAELEEALAAAQAEHREVQHQAREAHNRVAQLREQLATRPADEFAADGTVKAKTEAAKLYAQLQTAEHPPVAWERREHDAATKVSTAQRGLGWFVQTHVADLVKAREPDDVAINTRIIDAATDFIAAVVDKNRFEQEIAQLLRPAKGLDARTEIKPTDELGQLRIAVKKLIGQGVPSSMPMSICPPDGKLPPRVQTADGWISRANHEVGEEHARRKQQEREEQQRRAERKVQIGRFQPKPAGRGGLDEILDGLLGE